MVRRDSGRIPWTPEGAPPGYDPYANPHAPPPQNMMMQAPPPHPYQNPQAMYGMQRPMPPPEVESAAAMKGSVLDKRRKQQQAGGNISASAGYAKKMAEMAAAQYNSQRAAGVCLCATSPPCVCACACVRVCKCVCVCVRACVCVIERGRIDWVGLCGWVCVVCAEMTAAQYSVLVACSRCRSRRETRMATAEHVTRLRAPMSEWYTYMYAHMYIKWRHAILL
jgi:hypothetical protein